MVTLRFGVLTILKGSMCLDFLLIAFLVNERKCGLVDIEQSTDFTGSDSLVFCLLLLVQSLVVFTADDIFWIMPVDILFPVVPVEGNTLFLGLYGLAAFLGFAEERVLVGLVVVLVTVKCHRHGVEG